MTDQSRSNTTPKQSGKTTLETAKTAASEVASKTKTVARDLAASAAEQAQAQADAAKDSVADEVSGVASALRNAAREMRTGSPQERTFGKIAESLADASDAIKDKDLADMMHDANNLARRNPILFLGGAALLGFAAVRFVKASRPQDAPAATQWPDHSAAMHSPDATPGQNSPTDFRSSDGDFS